MEKNVVERDINLVDMFWAVCQKWRSIITFAVIFSVFIGVFSSYKSLEETNISEEKKTLEEMENELDNEEKKEIDLYWDYLKVYDEQLRYNKNAPIMQINANGFYVGEISYYVDNYFEVEYPFINKNNNIVAMVNAYKASINTESFATVVREELGLSTDDLYGMEMIDCSNLYSNKNAIGNNADRGIFTISVYASDEETCNKLKNLIKRQIAENKSEIVLTLGEHDITILQDICRFSSNADILAYQKSNLDKLQSCASYIASIEGKFNDNQKEYIKLYEENTDEEVKISNEVEEEQNIVQSINIRYFLIGFFVGGFLVIIFWGMVYVFNNKLRLEDDFENIFNIKLLGNIPVQIEEKKKWFAFLDGFIEKLRHINQRYFEQEKALDIVASNIRILSKKNNNKKIVVTGAICGNDEKKVIELLSKRLKGDEIQFVFNSSVLYDAESLEQLAEVGQVILIENVGSSLYQEIEKEIEICMHQKIKIFGCIVVY